MLPNTYTITDYHSYVPIQVKNTSTTHIARFFHKHKGDNAKLTKGMIDISYLVFKCNLTLIEKLILHDAIIAFDQHDKPTSDELWATVQPTSAGAAKFNMIICLAKISAVVTGGGANDADKPLYEEFFIYRKEAAEWIQKYLTYSNGDTKDPKYLKLASNPNTYTITDYHSYVPIQVKNASTTYIARFFHKHKGDNAKLAKGMIYISYLV